MLATDVSTRGDAGQDVAAEAGGGPTGLGFTLIRALP